ncbi:DUF1642 domain-containing protein [Listeria monocytogenes]|nr:DUF1642 domain-containing protein [Listeria monocytogenes]
MDADKKSVEGGNKMKFEVGERVQVIADSQIRVGTITEGLDDLKDGQMEVDLGDIYYYAQEEDIAKLDQPEPVVVPKFVAEWYEESKHRLDSALWDVIGSLRFTNASELTPVQNFIYTSGETIETLSAMKNGYVVAEEKEYYVELIPTVEGYLNLLTETETYEVNSAPECKGHKTKFTEKEIKAIDERSWAFAVPVEEVEAE